MSGQPITRTGDTITIGNGDPVHEIDITVSDEEYEAIRQTIPDEKADDPSAPIYHVGDTVYLENQEYRITELREDTVQLLPTGMSYPIYRAESRERFEQLLREDARNEATTEFLPLNPETVDQDHTEPPAVILLSGSEQTDEPKTPPQPAPGNFRIMDDNLGTGGPKEKFWRNIKAIATLKQIEQENRHAKVKLLYVKSRAVQGLQFPIDFFEIVAGGPIVLITGQNKQILCTGKCRVVETPEVKELRNLMRFKSRTLEVTLLNLHHQVICVLSWYIR